MSRPTAVTSAFAWLLIVFLGCAPDTGGRVGVSGNVTHQGQPLENGTIQFVSSDGSQMAGATISDGRYEIPAAQGLLPGEMTVRVSSASETSTPPPAEEAPGDPTAFAPREELIPAQYNSQSTLKTVIESDAQNTFDIDIP